MVIENVPRDQKIAFDLLGPPPYYNVDGALKGEPAFTIRPLPRGSQGGALCQELEPALLDQFEQQGYCYIVSEARRRAA